MPDDVLDRYDFLMWYLARQTVECEPQLFYAQESMFKQNECISYSNYAFGDDTRMFNLYKDEKNKLGEARAGKQELTIQGV
uniref:Uncharacterized protein n=1 Tax=Acrobeloides nanus TaxID=290746 RepID=A0A914BYQ5_9BILA